MRLQAALRGFGLSLLVAALGLMAGCGGKANKEGISGKVTMGGEPVSGEIIFNFAGKDFRSPIGTDGSYQIVKPPAGEASVTVKSMLAPAAPNVKGAPETGLGGTAKTGVAPPAKYAKPESSGLKYTYKGGEEKKDFELAP
jgi:hypothetical protein